MIVHGTWVKFKSSDGQLTDGIVVDSSEDHFDASLTHLDELYLVFTPAQKTTEHVERKDICAIGNFVSSENAGL